MADGAASDLGDNAALNVGVEPKNAHEPVQIPLRRAVERNV